MDDKNLRQQLINYSQQLASSGLSVGKSGNISVRCEQGFLITPTGMDYSELTPDDIVLLQRNGTPAPNQHRQASSEWHFHCGLYQARNDVHAIVHAHPTYCTALACSEKPIPAFHYMVAIAGGDDIPLAPYALFGTEELSQHAVTALARRQACLLAHHGMIAVGEDLKSAFNLAIEVETLAQQYCEVLKLGDAKLLTEQQMQAVIARFAHYGQRT